MRTEQEIRAAIAALDRAREGRRFTNTQQAAMHATNEVLRWALGEADHMYAALMEAASWRWTRKHEGMVVFVSGTGYRVEQYAARVWVSSREDGSPIQGLDRHSTRALAQEACKRDFEHRF